MMSKLFVSGLINMETTCAVSAFPVAYSPVEYNFFGVGSAASGVGLNVASALTALGDEVTLATFAGEDEAGQLVRSACGAIADCRFAVCRSTAQSVILYDPDGRRKIYTDLKDIQELCLPPSCYEGLDGFDAFCLCNINFSRALLPLAKATGKPVFCDVHCLSDIHDAYNADFMRYADVLFLSDEHIAGREEAFVTVLSRAYPCSVFVVGRGSKGALLYERSCDRFTRIPAVRTRAVVNTVGAGDALFSAFVHFYIAGHAPAEALRRAAYFASYKIGESGAAKGFLSEGALSELMRSGADI